MRLLWDNNVTSVAKREDVPFAYFKDGKEFQASVSVIQPVHSCGACGNEWTAEAGELIRDFAVQEARESEMKLLKDCPCCGLRQSDSDDDLIDSLHPTGGYWTEEPDVGRHYWSPGLLGKRRGDPALPRIDGQTWLYTVVSQSVDVA